MIDEDIISSAKKIILRTSNKEASNDTKSKSDNGEEIQDKINVLLNVIKQQEIHLRRVEQKVDMLLTNK